MVSSRRFVPYGADRFDRLATSVPLQPTDTDIQGHALNLQWQSGPVSTCFERYCSLSLSLSPSLVSFYRGENQTAPVCLSFICVLLLSLFFNRTSHYIIFYHLYTMIDVAYIFLYEAYIIKLQKYSD